ncbi:MAG: flagellar hook protein, partial [Oscillospiraceae bacterium]|nr:flagellar hook protein [Oscillospiraceae bacterium]
MASITSLSGGSSSVSSIYGNSNIISGLASGMDTESMIENAVSGIQNKIASLQQKSTKITWEQEAYRDIIDKLVNFANKYTSYSSSTNLLSRSFFNSAINITTNGSNKELVTASGKSSSEVKILGVHQLATAAKYTVS